MIVRRARVGDVLRLERRSVSVDPFSIYQEIGVRSFGKGIFHKEPVSGSDLGNKRVFEVHPGDLVLSNVFAWEGAVGRAGESERGRIGSHRFMTYVAASDDVDLSYMHYLFLSERGIALLNQASPGSAGRNKTLAIDRFEALNIPLPSIDEQRQIASDVDRRLALIQQALKLSSLNSSLFSALLSGLVDPKARRVPLGDVLAPHRDEALVSADATYRTIGVFSFGKGLFARPAILGSETKYKKLNRIRAGQFVFARLNAWEGGMAVVGPEFDGMYVSQEFPVFYVAADRAVPPYLGVLCQWPPLWDALMQRSRGVGARTGARRLRVHPEELLAVEIPLPSTEEQLRIVDLATKIAEALARVERRKQQMNALRTSMLNRAFAGLL